MPESPEIDLKPIEEAALKIAKDNGAIGQMQTKQDPVAFGLVAVLIIAMYEVGNADFEAIASRMAELDGVQSAEVAKMDLALG